MKLRLASAPVLAPTLALVSSLAFFAASCGAAPAGEKPAPAGSEPPFAVQELAKFDEPWAMAIDPGTRAVFVTEKKGAVRFLLPDGALGSVSGVPRVDYGGQGGLGDIAFAPGPTRKTLDRRTIYLTWAEAGDGDTRGAALGRGELVCDRPDSCALRGLKVIWRQQPKVTGRGHYSHRIAFSPDGKYLFLSSGERQKFDPAQDLSVNLGKVLRLLPDGSPAPGNPFARRGRVSAQIWSWGHRNVLGLAFDAQGRLWDLEHGPRGGDELNLVRPGANYGWPLVSDGDHYDGRKIPRHATRPDLAAPAISWNPVIAPGGMVIYRGDRFAGWKGQALIAAMAPAGIVRVAIEGDKASEVARYPTVRRMRAIAEEADGALLVLEDGPGGRLLRLTPKS